MRKKWYVLQVQTRYENRVKAAIERRIKETGNEELFGEVLASEEKVTSLINGVRKIISKHLYPGYIFINMELTTQTLHLVKGVSKVIGFVGGHEYQPAPLPEEEIDKIMQIKKKDAEPPKSKMPSKGDNIRIVEGPFTNFNGTVKEVTPYKGKLTALISIFKREISVELDLAQIEHWG